MGLSCTRTLGIHPPTQTHNGFQQFPKPNFLIGWNQKLNNWMELRSDKCLSSCQSWQRNLEPIAADHSQRQRRNPKTQELRELEGTAKIFRTSTRRQWRLENARLLRLKKAFRSIQHMQTQASSTHTICQALCKHVTWISSYIDLWWGGSQPWCDKRTTCKSFWCPFLLPLCGFQRQLR